MFVAVNCYKEGRLVKWTYDTDTSRVWDEKGIELLQEYPSRAWERSCLPFTKAFNPNKKIKELNLLEIMLGGKCNFECEYCSQLPIRDQIYSGKPSDVPAFIEMLKKTGITSNSIQLWGGEPLVYWKVLQKLIPALREEVFPEPQVIQIITNGSLLDLEKAKFFAKYKITCSISYDAGGQHKRGEDILEAPNVRAAIDYMRGIDPSLVWFGTTITRGNVNCQKIIQFYRNKGLAGRIGTHNIARVHLESEAQIKACEFSAEELNDYSKSVFDTLNGDKYPEDLCIRQKRDYIIRTLIQKIPSETIVGECSMPSSRGLLVNLKGDCFTCHNHATHKHYIGSIKDMGSIHATGYTYWKDNPECVKCPFIHGCKGGCPSISRRAHLLACPNLKALYDGVYKAAFASLFGVYVVSFEPMEATE